MSLGGRGLGCRRLVAAGSALAALALVAPAVQADNGTFISAGLTFPTVGVANPDPRTMDVSGLTGTVSRVTVQLNDVTHNRTDDIDLLLVGPGGQKSLLMSDAGGTGAISNRSFTFDDAATAPLSSSTSFSGVFKPSEYDNASDGFGVSAPGGPYTAALSAFNGTSPNGTWRVYGFDDFFQSSGAGNIASISLLITTVQPNQGAGGTTPVRDTGPAILENCTPRIQDVAKAGAVSACLRANEAGRFTATGSIRIQGRRGFRALPFASRGVTPVRAHRLRLKLPSVTRNAVRAALAARKRVSLGLNLTHADAAGNVARSSRTVRAKPRLLRRRR